MTFDHDFGYSSPYFYSLLKKREEEKENELAKIVIKRRAFLPVVIWKSRFQKVIIVKLDSKNKIKSTKWTFVFLWPSIAFEVKLCFKKHLSLYNITIHIKFDKIIYIYSRRSWFFNTKVTFNDLWGHS